MSWRQRARLGRRIINLQAFDGIQRVEGKRLGGSLKLGELGRLEGGDLDKVLKVIEQVLEDAPSLRDFVLARSVFTRSRLQCQRSPLTVRSNRVLENIPVPFDVGVPERL